MKPLLLILAFLGILAGILSLGEPLLAGACFGGSLSCGIGYAVIDRLDRIVAALAPKAPAVAADPVTLPAVASASRPVVPLESSPDVSDAVKAMKDALGRK